MQSLRCLINSGLLKCLWVRRKITQPLSPDDTSAGLLATARGWKATRVIRQESLRRLSIAPIHLLRPPQHPQAWSKVQIGGRRECSLALCPHVVYETLSVFPAVSSAALSFITPPCSEVNHRGLHCQHLLSAHNKTSDTVVDWHRAKQNIHTSLWFLRCKSRLSNSSVLFLGKTRAQSSLV